jgi:hypothetical protein
MYTILLSIDIRIDKRPAAIPGGSHQITFRLVFRPYALANPTKPAVS